MLKKSLVIATAMFASVVGLQSAQQAEAKVKFDIHIGVPGGYHGGGHWGHGHSGHWGHGGWGKRRISCYRGKRIVRNHGYRFIVPIDCSGSVYKFKARRGGARYLIKMKSRNGRIFARYHI